MKVDGSAFKAARKKVRAKYPGRGEPGQPATGTQEWLAEEARLSLRAVQYLEKGEASLKTITEVSKLLNIENWEEYILDFGAEYVACSAEKLVDFRPEQYPADNPDTFHNSCMLLTVDPLSILVETGRFKEIPLEKIEARLSGFPIEIDFIWMAEVSLTPAGVGWLGWVQEVEEIYLPATDKVRNLPIMFRQSNPSVVSWGDFVIMVEDSKSNQIYLDIELHFSRFTKEIRIFLAIELLQKLFADGRIKYSSNYPYRAQVKTIT